MLEMLVIGFLFAQEPSPPPRRAPSVILVPVDPDSLRVGRARVGDELLALEKSFRLTSVEDGVLFDLDGDGRLEQIAWTPPRSQVAFLAIDRDGDGVISSGNELVGIQSWPGALNAFHSLTKMARESNGGILRANVSTDDPLYEQLLLWEDRDHDGTSQPGELRPMSEVFAMIGLGYGRSQYTDEHGNRFWFRGWLAIRTAPGRNDIVSPEENVARVRPAFEVSLRTGSSPR